MDKNPFDVDHPYVIGNWYHFNLPEELYLGEVTAVYSHEIFCNRGFVLQGMNYKRFNPLILIRGQILKVAQYTCKEFDLERACWND